MANKGIQIYAIDEKGNESIIDDLYFFEEQGIHDFVGEGKYEKYKFRFELDMEGRKIIFEIDGGEVKIMDMTLFFNPKNNEAKDSTYYELRGGEK